jgi:predicted small lipoprotein YifL
MPSLAGCSLKGNTENHMPIYCPFAEKSSEIAN